jgi:hypothetical protein
MASQSRTAVSTADDFIKDCPKGDSIGDVEGLVTEPIAHSDSLLSLVGMVTGCII